MTELFCDNCADHIFTIRLLLSAPQPRICGYCAAERRMFGAAATSNEPSPAMLELRHEREALAVAAA
jgi:hypothetical protein